jgi:hypothetical protein
MITRKGYRRLYDAVSRRLRMEHDLVWEQAHGPIPVGFVVHHVNHDKLDNRLENLELLDPLVHKRIHSGCELRDGMWWKPCRKCGAMKAITEYYRRPDGVLPWCKSCQIANVVENRRQRRARRQEWPLPARRSSKEAAFDADGRSFHTPLAERQRTAA